MLARSPVNYFHVNAWRYWFDFGLCVLIGYSAGHLFLTSPLFSLPQLIAFPITLALLGVGDFYCSAAVIVSGVEMVVLEGIRR